MSLIPDEAEASVDTLGVFVLAVTLLGLALWAGVAGRDIGRREVCDAICPGADVEDVPPYCICEDVP